MRPTMPHTLTSLQAGRAIAAIAVVAHHTGTDLERQVATLPDWIARLLGLGDLGVDFFFVLSGFIIYFTLRTSSGTPQLGLSRFLGRRILRIFPAYLFVAVPLALAYTFLPDLSRGLRDWSWLTTLTLLPTGRPPALVVAWTLQHELVFYLLIAVCWFAGRLRLGLFCWVALILLLLPYGFTRQPGLSPIDLEFVFGIGAAWLVLSGRRVPALALAVVGIAGFAAMVVSGTIFVTSGSFRTYSVFAGAACACCLPALIEAERRGLQFRRGWLLLGEASYAIYLVHDPVLSVVVRVIAGAPPLLIGAACMVAGVAAGVVLHLVIERPLLAWLRHRLMLGPRNRGAQA